MTRTGVRAAAAGTVVAMAISGAVLAGTTGAQADGTGRQIAGTWRVTVQPETGPSLAGFESILVFTATGSVVEATSKAPSSAGLGAWDRMGAGRYATTIEKYRFSGATYLGKTVIEEVDEVAADGESYTGRATTTIVDAAGATLMSFSSTTTAQRM